MAGSAGAACGAVIQPVPQPGPQSAAAVSDSAAPMSMAIRTGVGAAEPAICWGTPSTAVSPASRPADSTAPANARRPLRVGPSNPVTRAPLLLDAPDVVDLEIFVATPGRTGSTRATRTGVVPRDPTGSPTVTRSGIGRSRGHVTSNAHDPV